MAVRIGGEEADAGSEGRRSGTRCADQNFLTASHALA